MNLTKKHFLIALSLVLVFGLFSFLANNITVVQAQRSAPIPAYQLAGWGWSSNIGWISFSSTNAGSGGGSYGVTLSEGSLSGYAWSSNIGWIKFEGDATHPNPTVNMTTGAVSGWAHACSGSVNGNCTGGDRTDGWDGWISLSGTNHETNYADGSRGITFNPVTGKFNGKAWGSEVVGWLSFDSAVPGVPVPPVTCTGSCGNSASVNVVVTPSTVQQGGQASISWDTSNVSNCIASGDWSGSRVEDNPTGEPTGVLNTIKTYTYILTCDANSGGTIAGSDTVVVTPVTQGTGLDMWIESSAGTHLSSITIKKGSNAKFKWSSTSIPLDECIGTILKPDGGQIPLIPTQLNTGTYTLVDPLLGTSLFNISCKNLSNEYVPAKAPNLTEVLRVIVKDSTIEEI